MVLLGPNFAQREKHESITLVGCLTCATGNSEMHMIVHALNKDAKRNLMLKSLECLSQTRILRKIWILREKVRTLRAFRI
jgi:hypothetical protein